MENNAGSLDRGARVVVAIAAAIVGARIVEGPWSVVAYVVATVMLLTAIVGFCPLYKLFGVNTSKIFE